MPLNNFLTTTFINGSERRGEELPETMHISRHEYPAWIEEQKQNSYIRYYETTNGRPERLFKNRNYLLNGYTPSAASSDEHPVKRARGRRGFIFNQHFKCRFSKICGCQAGLGRMIISSKWLLSQTTILRTMSLLTSLIIACLLAHVVTNRTVIQLANTCFCNRYRGPKYHRFTDTFSQLQIEVGKTNEQQRVPPRIINNLATSFISHIQKLKSWNSNPQGPTDHQQRY
ncbi:hypothetical protein BX666DRAFT_1055839 [Dichotomocladium elegans]|nr:hypothetical protein BX666DRAFT_1055839 [Dichotomocladium elegans]